MTIEYHAYYSSAMGVLATDGGRWYCDTITRGKYCGEERHRIMAFLAKRSSRALRSLSNYTSIRCSSLIASRTQIPAVRCMSTLNRSSRHTRSAGVSRRTMPNHQQIRYNSNTQGQWTPPEISGRSVTILGGGVLGRRIACAWVAAGYEVILCDLNEGQRNAAKDYIDHHIEEFSKITSNTRKPAKFTVVESMENAVKNAWLVIEALPEKLDLKVSMMGQLDEHAPHDCILASNSSSYKSSLMLDKVDPSRRHRVCNMHYYMPPVPTPLLLLYV